MTCATYSINWLVFITEMKSVYCAVRTGSLNKAVCSSYLKGLTCGNWAQNRKRRLFRRNKFQRHIKLILSPLFGELNKEEKMQGNSLYLHGYCDNYRRETINIFIEHIRWESKGTTSAGSKPVSHLQVSSSELCYEVQFLKFKEITDLKYPAHADFVDDVALWNKWKYKVASSCVTCLKDRRKSLIGAHVQEMHIPYKNKESSLNNLIWTETKACFAVLLQ